MSDYDGRGLKFGTVAEDYDRYRPGPPEEARELFGDLSGQRVLEVGAGTGKLTRFVLGLGAKVSIVEPDEAMRAILLRQSPEVAVLDGSAEQVGAPDASFDDVVSSSAWHWFRQPDATNEMARLLVDDGRIFVLWNGISRDDPWAGELVKMRERPDDTQRRPRGWEAGFDPEGLFVDARDVEIHYDYRLSVEDVVALFGTYSSAIIRTEEDRRDLARRIEQRVRERFGDGPVDLAMTLRGTIARRRPR